MCQTSRTSTSQRQVKLLSGVNFIFVKQMRSSEPGVARIMLIGDPQMEGLKRVSYEGFYGSLSFRPFRCLFVWFSCLTVGCSRRRRIDEQRVERSYDEADRQERHLSRSAEYDRHTGRCVVQSGAESQRILSHRRALLQDFRHTSQRISIS